MALGRTIGLAVGILGIALVSVHGAAAAEATSDWMTDEGGVLELKLAHQDKNGPDGGILRIDRNKRLVLWEGIPGEVGCKIKLEASFDDVKAVGIDDRQVGFTLELRKGKPKSLELIPAPYVMSLLEIQGVAQGGLQQKIDSSTSSVRGPDGEGMRAGGSTGGVGPSTKRIELPKEVVGAKQKAVHGILQALGRE